MNAQEQLKQLLRNTGKEVAKEVRGKKPEKATCRFLWSIAHSISRPIIIYDSDRAGCQCRQTVAVAATCVDDDDGRAPSLARGPARRRT